MGSIIDNYAGTRVNKLHRNWDKGHTSLIELEDPTRNILKLNLHWGPNENEKISKKERKLGAYDTQHE